MNIRCAKDYFENFLKIKTKDGRVLPFRMNKPQARLYDIISKQNAQHKPVRIIILKARQMGFSTFTEANLFFRTATRANVNSFIVAHVEDATSNLFGMSKLFYDELPDPIRPMKKSSTAQELVFENSTPNSEEKKKYPGLRSRIRCVTAGGHAIGRGFTINNLHLSEFAFWPGNKMETLNGIMQSVPNSPESMIVIESTANGYDEFHDLWEKAVRGENDFIPVFFPWHEMDEYRMKVPPDTEWTDEENKLKDEYNLDDEQLSWRRWCIRNNCGGDINKFHQEYPSSPDEAFISSGTCVFDTASVIAARNRAVEPLMRGEFEYDYDGLTIRNIRFSERKNGCISIYSPPEKGVPYVIGGDTAGDGSDYFTAHVLDNRNGEQAAVLRHQFDEDLYARQMYCLGTYYNTALMAVETNYSTYPVKELQRLSYERQYVREVPDNFTGATRHSFGFDTNSKTRPLIISGLISVARDSLYLIRDKNTLGEMLVFIRNEHGRAEAMQGEHDDLVMALAIAHYIRPFQDYATRTPESDHSGWTEDMIEDYNSADAEQKKIMDERWKGIRR